jgi:lipopolysaccharide/colanic/teichoic acid biosynthesis glycosyltransferase
MMRRFVDVLVAILFLILTLPVMMILAMLIKFDSPGPVLYTPRMVGKNGKVFSLFRFRTMLTTPVPDKQNRLTRVGSSTRNYSLDHLPMLLNLLLGDLTLVGPRPMEIEVIDILNPIWQKYFQVKPGLFNYAVLKLGKLWTPGRMGHPTLNQELELEYLQKRSIGLDLHLVIESLRSLITSGGNIKARGEPDPEIKERRSNQ